MSDHWYDDVERLWFKLGDGPRGESRLYLVGKLSDQPGVRWDDPTQAGIAVVTTSDNNTRQPTASQDISAFGPWSRTNEILARRIKILEAEVNFETSLDTADEELGERREIIKDIVAGVFVRNEISVP